MFAPWSGINFSLAAGVSLMNIGKLRLDTFLHEIRGQVSKFLEINKIILYFRIICIRFIKQSPFSSIHKTRKIGICSCNVSLSPSVSLLKQESIAGCDNNSNLNSRIFAMETAQGFIHQCIILINVIVFFFAQSVK